MDFLISKKDDGSYSSKQLREYMDGLKPGRYSVRIERATKRSLEQNAWFHAVLPQIKQGLRDAGYYEIQTEEDAKDFVKSLFFKKTVSNGIDSVEVIEKTSEQSKVNFAEKATDIIIWAKEYLGIDIAPPGKQFEFFE